MESYALYINAARAGKKAMSVLSVSDSFVTEEAVDSTVRQTGFSKMMELSLEVACGK